MLNIAASTPGLPVRLEWTLRMLAALHAGREGPSESKMRSELN